MNPQSDCVFCGIVAEKEPASKIYEDDKVISFMSIQPIRAGMLMHGFGVSHAHLILVPQHHPDDLTSGRFAHLEEGRIIFSLRHIPIANRSVLDEHARLLAIGR